MNAEQFFRLTEKMRAKQQEYFRTRSQRALHESKDLERRVDEEIERVNKVLQERYAPKLPFEDYP
jgi:hypothetical protein